MSQSISGYTPVAISPVGKPQQRDAQRTSSGAPLINSHPTAQKLQQMADKGSKVSGIVDQYNLRNIRYTDLEKMAKELREVGALKESEFLDFLPPSMEFSNLDGSRNADWNAPKDYLDLQEQKLASARGPFFTDERTVRHHEQTLALLKRFEQPRAQYGDASGEKTHKA